ncbi:hypothetical protein BOTBODRAFT_626620 [Botryobasidium botryosum FD-172 SS1]|uniref:Nuclear pore complex protein Nup160 n=1 Tax=Botryobasidium botryosum (strain FD-172 SS1) TaxID=930990 RepID=A0A067N907_BOTB1|nr:hypothetical protein BOTBODRAFT_626620 [Botryobasidium botryosum FD-172 SS1]
MPSYTYVATHISSISPPSAPEALQIPTLQTDLPLSEPSSSSDLLPEHASFSYLLHEPGAQILLRLINDSHTIELVFLSGEIPPVRLDFPSPVLPNPGIMLEHPEIHVIACTVSGSLYRIILPLKDIWTWFPPRGTDWCEEYLVKYPAGSLEGPVHVKEAGTVFVGLKDGALLKLQASRVPGSTDFQEWNETTLRISNMMSFSSFLPSFNPRSQHGYSQVVSFATVPDPSPSLITVTLHRDRRLRVWENGCVATAEIPHIFSPDNDVTSKASQPLGSEPRSLLRILPAMELDPTEERLPEHKRDFDANLRILIFMPSPSGSAGGYFSVYRLSKRNSQGHRALHHLGSKDCSSASDRWELRDFCVISDTLWALWDKQGRAFIEHTSFDLEEDEEVDWVPMSDPREPELTAAHFNDHLSSHGSLTDLFLTALLRPGVFSRYTLQSAIRQYVDALGQIPGVNYARVIGTSATLSQRIATVVGCTVDLATDPQTGEKLWTPFWNALKRDWEGFVARCSDIERVARWPLALSVIEGEERVVVIERERLGYISKEDEAIRMRNLVSSGQASPDRSSVENLLIIARGLRSRLPQLARISLENDIITMVRQDNAFSYQDILSDLSKRALIENLPDGTEAWLTASLSSIDNIEHVISTIFEAILHLGTDVKVEENEEDGTGAYKSGELSKGLTAAYVSATIQARYELALSTFLILLFIVEPQSEDSAFDPSVLGQAFSTLHVVSTLYYLSRQPAGDPDGTRLQSKDEDIHTRFASMRVIPGIAQRSEKRAQPTYSLLHILLPNNLPHAQSPRRAAHHFLRTSKLLDLRPATAAYAPEMHLMKQLWETGFLGVAGEIASWFSNAPAITYLRGRLWLESGRTAEAATMLEKVGNSFAAHMPRQPNEFQALTTIFPAATEIETVSGYYHHISTLFESLSLHSEVVSFCKLSIDTAPPEDTKDMWFKVFRGYVELALYEEAYMALIQTPFEDLKHEFIRHLVTIMCENEEVDQLMKLNFIGFQSEVEDTLAFKARNTDPLARPNYARILYAWHVFKGDYRSAGSTMYQHGRQLSELFLRKPGLDFYEVAVAQASAYLTAINALSLIDAKNAWATFTVSPDDLDKQRRLPILIPEERFTAGVKDMEIVKLSDIRQEYTLVLSKLELVQHFPDLAMSTFTMSSEDVVFRYIQIGNFDSAMAAARTLKVDMTGLFGHLTAQCLRLTSLGDEMYADPAELPWLLSDRVVSWEGTSSQRGWRYLRLSLETHDNAENDYIYYKAVVQKVLDLNRFGRIPPWLVKFFQDKQPEYLILTSLRYELLRDALKYTLDMVQQRTAPLNITRPQQASSTWLPYTLIDEVIAACKAQTKLTKEDAGLLRQLREEVSIRVKRVKKWTEERR